ncbi:MAG: penicillin-binding protein 1A [Zetaproteobacteria bacterium CG_4_9_14_3_um_filter_49_83]|nr:MAG: penicillin-binding protein 1A [Zetaproteobacteria bacterium CG1_02_49_23]PIQ30012.1 MAG: penicillin-binding protein 1A [Zetaproteobacteria bacterium CG17_big_fil_post_rev_8_21_14_2_50_50_13]PIV29032.1 MAG: penicillin-binding protein 1A [Zetaproteobacteria bacterium CG02_land_8_20_14_3_00_50_9]PIY56040.1 MAG: penicillin-binding protein 1A [Zetaproteobacteria bacterium CG_4_10_14_0_8_um_filter_49_80]PJA36402.1 MAG: penicillin-binding protein 1A [Zetaproteobacteria bacterium CG_4_9_14_3_um
MAKSSLLFILVSVIIVTLGYFYYSSKLPTLASLATYQPPLVTRVYSDQGELLAEYADEHRILTPFSRIPKKVSNAFLAAEDQQFYEHPGINPARVLSAALANLKAGHTVQGGSTITQQVAKNFLLSSEKKLSRKIKEAILSYRIEQQFSKDDILYLYLNQIYLGRGAYGVASAAWRYYGKTLDELTLAECAMLAGLPKAPGKYAPHLDTEIAKKRRNTVLYLMERSGFASANDVRAALDDPIEVKPLYPNKLEDAYGHEVHQQLVHTYGLKTLRNQGLTIVVPYNGEAETSAVSAIRKGVLEVEQRQFFRIPENHPEKTWSQMYKTWRSDFSSPPTEETIIPAVIEKITPAGELQVNDGQHQWLISKPTWQWEAYTDEMTDMQKQHPRRWLVGDQVWLQGDGKQGVRLSQQPSIESSLYAIDLERGTVLARVGGYQFSFGGFDRITQAKRQPGSAFKPLLYATAMENNFTPASIVMDTPLVFDNGNTDSFWRPENYKNKFAGPVTLRNALEHSRNLSSIKLLQDLGIRTFTDKLRDFPFDHEFPNHLSLALGATEVTLEQLTEAYIPLADQGRLWKPVLIEQVQDRTGTSVHRSVAGHRCQTCHASPVLAVGTSMQPARQVLEPSAAFLTENMMQGVIQNGTGQRARALNRPAAGKTGTTNNQVDAWFMGFTPQILTGVWTGRDNSQPMGRQETGARAALPTWLQAMQAFHTGKATSNFVAPVDIEWVMIDRKTGKLAGPDTKNTLMESFKQGTAPTETDTSTEEKSAGNFFDAEF